MKLLQNNKIINKRLVLIKSIRIFKCVVIKSYHSLSRVLYTPGCINKLTKSNYYKITSRFLMKAVLKGASMGTKSALTAPNTTGISNAVRSSATESWRFKKKSEASKKLASDDDTGHPHRVENVCVKPNCEIKKCPQLCDNSKEIRTSGHFTHDPIVGKYHSVVGDIDAKGKQDTQYYTKNCDSSKKVDAATAAHYKNTKQMKPCPDIETYAKKPEIASKIPD